ncbi:hypothetical protein KKA85_03930 [bacterium]|nr:hypothetical protein [bacterium]MBU1674910.1 hypothetical protein [bacterium]
MSAAASGPTPVRVLMVCAALAILAILLIYMSHRDASSRVDQVEALMVSQAGAIADVIAVSSLHGLEAYNLYDKELRRNAAEASGAVRDPGAAAAATDSLAAARAKLGPGHLIRTLGAGHGVRYVVIQNEYGILAASGDVTGFPLPGDDPGLRPLAEGAERITREYESPAGKVFEVARVVSLGSPGDVLLRIGLDNSILDDVRGDIRRRTLMRAIVLLFSVILASSLLMAWQRQSTLSRAVTRIERELRAREAEARRSEKLVAMGALASGVAHQVRNPLNAIHMIAQRLVRRDDVTADVREQAGLIRNESARIEEIVQQFLDFASPRQPALKPIALGEVVRETVDTAAAAYYGDGIVCDTRIADLDAELDRDFVLEILENLLRNAAEALAGSGTLRVSLTRDENQALLIVEDDGPGVRPEHRDRVFDLYFTTRPDGTGLGLSLTAQMVAAMGGSIALAEPSAFPGGARFEIRFPLSRSSR